jgi:Domain of unknown function (DUF4376)
MHALVLGGRVIQIEEVPFEVAAPLEWVDTDSEVRPGWLVVDGVPVAPEMPVLSLADRRAAMVEAITAERDRRLAAGAPYAGRRIEVSDKSRADLSGMMATALGAASGSLPWPEGYARGWIAIDNARIGLPTPEDGLALGGAVGDWYAAAMQHARDLKDMVLSSDEPEAVDAMAGWPG